MKSLANKLEVLKEFFAWNGRLSEPEVSVEKDGVSIRNPFNLTAEQAIEKYGKSTMQELVDKAIEYKIVSLASTVSAMYQDLGGDEVFGGDIDTNPKANDVVRPDWAYLVDAMDRAYVNLRTHWTVDAALELMRACNRLRGHESDIIYWLDLNQDVLDLMEVLDD